MARSDLLSTINALKDLAAEGFTVREASDETGIPISSIYQYEARFGFKMRRLLPSEARAAKLRGRKKFGRATDIKPLHSPALPLPSTDSTGAYEPKALVDFFRAAQAAGLMEADIARSLRVPIHRVVYLRNGGLAVFERRAG